MLSPSPIASRAPHSVDRGHEPDAARDRGAATTPLDRLDDIALVHCVRRGGSDRLAAFDEIDRRYRRPLTALAGRLLSGSGYDPEDAVQDTLLRAHAALQRDQRPMALGPWLRVILRHRCVDLVREGRRPVTGEVDVDGLPGGPTGGASDAFDAVVARERVRLVLGAVADLPARQRYALSARVMAGESTEEIAGVLGTSDGAVKSLVRRARRELEAVAA